ncbi:glycerol-3-phosphate dehydrogenase [Erythrobacter neustonensis]|uniref:Glycerol-3-phosphate dehydrogenase n=1 Tax=Erythrobacter neustonensis TaxID=1112 RepID=A0A192D5X8_9SPHN|nr:glycerol-3-phosphate dehydrogenase [Erythrobacter neustonensis]ANK13908.1 glycerol-3-phosphate dehydrogenase [Erythrobacter neustonensis]
MTSEACDLLIVGGGINGTGIARDAAGRGLSVVLVEQDDLASHTSSASTKLIHGGLRYLEYCEFRLVREALKEREVLWGMAPHIIWPMRFVLPQSHSPRPAWMVRAGLFLYDHIGGRKRLPATESLRLAADPRGRGLRHGNDDRAFEYSDCWVEDSRLVVLNAVDAHQRGARIMTRTRFASARRTATGWEAQVSSGGITRTIRAKAIVNAAGPWVADVLGCLPHRDSRHSVRLIKGSHIVVPRLYEGDHAFMLQNADKRIVFAIPYEGRFTLVGTTDEAWDKAPGPAQISAGETRYLLDTIRQYFEAPVREADIVWSFAGIRPLFDDKAADASAVTRDYVLDCDSGSDFAGAPVLSVYGGKITTYRKLAEHALEELAGHFPAAGRAWTSGAVLPGGDLPGGDFAAFVRAQQQARPALPADLIQRLCRAYGTRIAEVLGDAKSLADLGEDFGGGLYACEVDYLVRHEWARCAEDILFRRSKLGIHVSAATRAALDAYLGTARERRAG